jgi:hypothetical protein
VIRHNLPASKWRKSSYSPDNGGNCVEIQRADAGSVALGDSKDRPRGAFILPSAAWISFVTAVKSGELAC